MESFFATIADQWPPDRSDYRWHLLFDAEVTRQVLWEPSKELTHRGGVVSVAPEWHHLTLLHSGPGAEIAEDELHRIIQVVRKRCASVTPSEITLDRPLPGSVAIEGPARQGVRARELGGSPPGPPGR